MQEKREVGYQECAAVGKPLCVLGRPDRQQCTGGKNSSRLTVFLFCFVFVLLLMIRQQTEIRHMAILVERTVRSVWNPTTRSNCRLQPLPLLHVPAGEIFFPGERSPNWIRYLSFLPPRLTSPNHHSPMQHSATPGLSLTLSPHRSVVVPPLIIYRVEFYNPTVAVFTAFGSEAAQRGTHALPSRVHSSSLEGFSIQLLIRARVQLKQKAARATDRNVIPRSEMKERGSGTERETEWGGGAEGVWGSGREMPSKASALKRCNVPPSAVKSACTKWSAVALPRCRASAGESQVEVLYTSRHQGTAAHAAAVGVPLRRGRVAVSALHRAHSK